MSDHKSYEDLVVWQKSIALTKSIYQLTSSFPKDEMFGLVSQMRRSAISVASNIAEGCGRNHYGEFLQFLGMAKGSASELHTQLIIAREIEIISINTFEGIEDKVLEVSKMLSGLIKSIRTTKNAA